MNESISTNPLTREMEALTESINLTLYYQGGIDHVFLTATETTIEFLNNDSKTVRTLETGSIYSTLNVLNVIYMTISAILD